MTSKPEITLTLDLDAYIASMRHTWNNDEERFEEPVTLEELILNLAARILADRAVRSSAIQEEWNGLTRRVHDIRDQEIRARIIPAVEEAIAAPFRASNAYGELTGPEITLRDCIMKEAKSYLTKPVSSGYGESLTVIQKFIRDEVKKTIDAEMKDALSQARAEVSAAVKDRAAELIADTILKLSGQA